MHDDERTPAVAKLIERMALVREPQIEIVISNTTEVGITLHADDTFDARAPRSYPGKLTRFLFERATAFDYDAGRGVVVFPCELIEQNCDVLRGIVCELARRWSLGTRFERWIAESVIFCNTLVDRIVAGALPADEAARIARHLGYRDGRVTACEPYALLGFKAMTDFAGDWDLPMPTRASSCARHHALPRAEGARSQWRAHDPRSGRAARRLRDGA